MPLKKSIIGFCISLLFLLIVPINTVLAQTEQPDFSNQNCLKCHADIQQYFSTSVHSDLSCLTCHANINSAHLQNSTERTGKPEETLVSPQNVPETCGACHNKELNSYKESVHGRALLLGTIKTANCIDCHGSHNVLAVSDSQSTVAAANVPRTCGKCHVAPKANYAAGIEHKSLADNGTAQHNTFKFFIWLTILTVIGLILHMEMELLHLLKRARRQN
ncbi:MAG TPA: molecular chaperone DnaJ [Syntrophomonadaceae bacterium]|nr:molecular chaperone DnaJ [Syntrophomonadaceae bacterium]